LVSLGQEIIEQRVLFLKDIEPYVLEKADRLFARSADLTILYESKVLDANNEIILRDKIEQNQAKEIAAGVTLYGPHRDDFVFLYKGKPLRTYGSRGQQRLAGIVLVLAIGEHIYKSQQVKPILLLDDIYSELDKTHRDNVEKVLKGYKNSQVVLTSSTLISEK